ncbi:MAG: N-acetylglucosamine-6-phosphate deacetylase, partial [Devosia nanyangense]|nr:N-acetylglucosamine-6-phosphate deacetylase [Devosia nanyangense]
ALRLATVNPGRFASDRGLMQVGQPADLITFDWQPGARRLALREVWVAGQRKSA